jgi:hypothetical protein
LIHLCAGSHTVDRQKQDLLRLHGVHDLIYGLHYVGPHLVKVHQLADSLEQLRVNPVDAVVHYAIQIQVQVVYTTALILNQQISRRKGGTRGTHGEMASLSLGAASAITYLWAGSPLLS